MPSRQCLHFSLGRRRHVIIDRLFSGDRRRCSGIVVLIVDGFFLDLDGWEGPTVTSTWGGPTVTSQFLLGLSLVLVLIVINRGPLLLKAFQGQLGDIILGFVFEINI